MNAFMKHTLIGLCILFSGVLLYEMSRNYSPDVGSSVTTEDPSNKKAGVPADKPVTSLEDYAGIIERPLFSPDRKPYEAEVVEAKPNRPVPVNTPLTKREDYSLSAVIITDDKRMALIETKNGKKIHRLREGEELDGWTLTDVQPARVSLKKGSEVKELELAVVPSSYQPIQQTPPRQAAGPTSRPPASLNDESAYAAGAAKIGTPQTTPAEQTAKDTAAAKLPTAQGQSQ